MTALSLVILAFGASGFIVGLAAWLRSVATYDRLARHLDDHRARAARARARTASDEHTVNANGRRKGHA